MADYVIIMDNGIRIPIDSDDYQVITEQMSKSSHEWLWIKSRPKNDDTVVMTSKITAIVKEPVYDKNQIAEIIEKDSNGHSVIPDTFRTNLPEPEYPYHVTCKKV